MPDFAPQSWEMPSDKNLVHSLVVANVRGLSGRRMDCHARLVRLWKASHYNFLWVQSLGDEGDAGMIICDAKSRGRLFPQRFLPEVAESSIIRTLKSALHNGHLIRLFFLNQKGQLRSRGESAREELWIYRDGSALWVVREKGEAVFHWGQPVTTDEFIRIGALEVWRQVQSELENPDSEAAFARHFAHLEHSQRRALILKWARGSESKFQSKLLYLLLKHDIWDQLPQSHKLTLSFRSSLEITFEDDVAVYEVDPSPSFLNDIERLVRFFEPLDLNVTQRQCVRDWMQSHFCIEVSAQRPTAHERLEAHLRWREWLEEHGV